MFVSPIREAIVAVSGLDISANTQMPLLRNSCLCLAVLLGISPYATSRTEALSCVPTSTKIGVIQDISEEDGMMNIALTNVFAFDEELVRGEGLSFDAYTKLAKAYADNDYEALKQIDNSVWDPQSIAVARNILEYVDVDVGDIVLHGPPFHVCDYGLNAFYSKDGMPISAHVKSDYHHFTEEDPNIEVYPGRNISCNESNICEVEINFIVGREAFSLRPEQSHSSHHQRIDSITAISASLPEANGDDDEQHSDPWGLNTFAEYIIAFHPQKPPAQEPTCEPYVCSNGEVHPSCSEDGHEIHYIVHPCHFSQQIQSFNDVPETHINAKAIAYVKEQGIVSGYADGTFKPDDLINRAEFTKIIIASVFSGDAIETCQETSLFSDATMQDWFGPFVCIAKEEEIIGGYPDGSFKPESLVNFAEAAKIVVMAFHIATDPDDHLSIWWKPYVYGLAHINGLPASFSDPNQYLTRGDMAEIMYRVMTGLGAQ